MAGYERYISTGNKVVSIPAISPDDAGINCFHFLSMQYKGQVGMYGSRDNFDLLRPFLCLGKDELKLDNLKWDKMHYWLPRFKFQTENLILEGTICAPLGQSGFFYDFRVKNTGSKRLSIIVGLRGKWESARRMIYEEELIRGRRAVGYGCYEGLMRKNIRYEFFTDVKQFSLIQGCSHQCEIIGWRRDVELSPFEDISAKQAGSVIENEKSEGGIHTIMGKEFDLSSGEEVRIQFYIGLGLTEQAAGRNALNMYQSGINGDNSILLETTSWLKDKIKTVGDPELDRIMNTNYFFYYFFAHGITLDTGEVCLVTSRDPKYSVSMAYWARDNLLWGFPALLDMDIDFARAAIEAVYQRHMANLGIISHLINGAVCEYGFELDEVCAPVIALGWYIERSKDESVLRDSYIAKGLRKIEKELWSRRHPEEWLFSTDYLPDDFRCVYPYTTHNNVLVWKTFLDLAYFQELLGNEETQKEYLVKAQMVKEAIWKHCLMDGPHGKMFAWEVDLKGNKRMNPEQPNGSLKQLPYLGFCHEKDEVFSNTVKTLFDAETKPHLKGYTLPETGIEAKEGPFAGPFIWIINICHSILLNSQREHALKVILNSNMNDGIASERVHQETGKGISEGFATTAGFLAHAIYFSNKGKK